MLEFLTPERSDLEIPFIDQTVNAGFPSPGENEFENKLNLNDYVVKHPAATFFIRVSGSSMEDAHIFDQDILVVDRSIESTLGKIIVARVGGEFTVKRLKKVKDQLFLVPENPKFPPIEIKPDTDFEVWGVVTYVLHKCTP